MAGSVSDKGEKENKLYQCCGAGAGGAKIISGPGAGAENKF